MGFEFKDVLDLENVLEQLFTTRKVFHSEADFQFALGTTIHEMYSKYRVRFEYVPGYDSNVHIDILVITDEKKFIPIELKYRTKEAEIKYEKEKFKLKNQSAINLGCYNYIKDIARIERFSSEVSAEEGNFICGFTVMLTNDESYKKKPGDKASYSDFSINGDAKRGILKWKDKIPKGASKQIDLKGTYPMEWKDGPEIEGETNSKFFYLVNQIKKPN